jgi:choline dehydrogenase-like flavoprotein
LWSALARSISAALLLRSGIGPGAALSRLGIDVAVRRDGVGRNLIPVETWAGSFEST